MKNLRKYPANLRQGLSFIMIIILTFLFTGCASGPPQTIQCSVLIDVTGSNSASLTNIDSEEFLKIFDLSNHSNRGIEYRQAFITETFLNYTHQYKLPKVSSVLTYNEFDREEAILEFEENIQKSLALFKEEIDGRETSSVYIPFAREINRLAKSDDDIKQLVLFSDLIENSDWLTFFQKSFQEELLENPAKIEEYFQNELPLAEDLTGIEIYIVHKPHADDNFYFKKISRVYQTMLSKRGAKVKVQANLLL